jgi:hypothetical protein
LIQADGSSARELDLGHRTPPCLFDRGATDTFALEELNLAGQVIAHEVELIGTVDVRRMDGELCGREREDEPTVTSVNGRVTEDVSEERPIRRSVSAVHDHMCTEDHQTNSLFDFSYATVIDALRNDNL